MRRARQASRAMRLSPCKVEGIPSSERRSCSADRPSGSCAQAKEQWKLRQSMVGGGDSRSARTLLAIGGCSGDPCIEREDSAHRAPPLDRRSFSGVPAPNQQERRFAFAHPPPNLPVISGMRHRALKRPSQRRQASTKPDLPACQRQLSQYGLRCHELLPD